MAYEIERVLTDNIINELDTEIADKLDEAIEQDELQWKAMNRKLENTVAIQRDELMGIQYLIESLSEIRSICNEIADLMRDTYEIVQDI